MFYRLQRNWQRVTKKLLSNVSIACLGYFWKGLNFIKKTLLKEATHLSTACIHYTPNLQIIQ